MRFALHSLGTTFLLTLLTLLTTTCDAAEPLHWKFAADQVLDYEITQDTNIKMLVGDKAVENNSQQIFDVRWTVKEVKPDGSAVVEQSIQRVRLKTTTGLPLGDVLFDSDADGDGDQGATVARLRDAYAGLIKQPLRVTISPAGEITLMSAPTELAPLVNEETIRQMLASSSLVFPDKELSEGDAWTGEHEIALPSFGTMTIQNSYTLGASADGIVTIGVQPTLKLTARGDVQMKINEQAGEGEFRFDASAGCLVSSQVTQDMQLQLTVQNEKISQTLHQVSRMTKK